MNDEQSNSERTIRIAWLLRYITTQFKTTRNQRYCFDLESDIRSSTTWKSLSQSLSAKNSFLTASLIWNTREMRDEWKSQLERSLTLPSWPEDLEPSIPRSKHNCAETMPVLLFTIWITPIRVFGSRWWIIAALDPLRKQDPSLNPWKGTESDPLCFYTFSNSEVHSSLANSDSLLLRLLTKCQRSSAVWRPAP